MRCTDIDAAALAKARAVRNATALGQLRGERADETIASACGVDRLHGASLHGQSSSLAASVSTPRLPSVMQMVWSSRA